MDNPTNTMKAQKPNPANYEPIPDVEEEHGNISSSTNYNGFDDPQQIELLSYFDVTIQNNSTFQFTLPKVTSDDMMITTGPSLILSMIQPTITTIISMAFVLSSLHQFTATSTGINHTISSISILVYPYINATIVFVASFRSIESRCMTSMEPIFPKIQTIPKTIQSSLQDLNTNVNTTMDTIEMKVKAVLAPTILPTLQIATQYENVIKTVQPNIDIPDATDLDHEIQDIRTILSKPIQDATIEITKQTTDTTSTIPYPFQSATHFYWSIVIPVAILCLCTQWGVVYYSTTRSNFSTTTANTDVTTETEIGPVVVSNWTDGGNKTSQLLRGSRSQWNDMPSIITSKASTSILDFTSSIIVPSLKEIKKNDHIVTDISGNDNVGDVQIEAVTNTTTDEWTSIKDEVVAQKDDLTLEMNSTLSHIKDELHYYEIELQNQTQIIQQEIQDFESNIDTEISQVIGPAKSMIQSILLSYLISLLQLGLVFLLTSPKVKAYIMNRMMQRACRQFDETLHRTGVSDSMYDIFQVRLVRIRAKLLQMFTSVQTIHTYLGQLGLLTTNVDGSTTSNTNLNSVAALTDTAKSFTTNLFRFGK